MAGQYANVQLVVPRVGPRRRRCAPTSCGSPRARAPRGRPGSGCRGRRTRGRRRARAAGRPHAGRAPVSAVIGIASTSSSRPNWTRRSRRPSRSCTCRPAGSSARRCSAAPRVWASSSWRSSWSASPPDSSGCSSRSCPPRSARSSYVWSRITKSLRYSIAGTPDGVRIGYGLLSTGNETIPPGRIHAIEVEPAAALAPVRLVVGRINLAGHSVSAGNEAGSAPSCSRWARRRRPPGARAPAARLRCGRRSRSSTPASSAATARGLHAHAPPGRLAAPVLVAAHRVRRRRTASRSSGGGGCCAASRSCRSRACSASAVSGGRSSGCSASPRCACTRSPARFHRRCRSPTATTAFALLRAAADEAAIAPHPTRRTTGARPRHDRSRADAR